MILGNGMLWAIFICKPGTKELDADFTDQLEEKAMQKGVYSIRTGCGTIKLGPPLTITEDALKEAINVYIECMHEMILDYDTNFSPPGTTHQGDQRHQNT